MGIIPGNHFLTITALLGAMALAARSFPPNRAGGSQNSVEVTGKDKR